MTARIPDSNGWFEIPANPLTQVGVFDYLGRSINAPIADKIYKVLRPPEELSSPETLNSLRLSPLIINHIMLGDPAIGDNYVPAETRPIHGVIGDKVFFNPDDGIVYGNIKVWSQTLDRRTQGGKLELSLGYKSTYDFTPGIWNGIPYDAVQRNQRGNHIAGVPDGRMGDNIYVLDANEITATFDSKDFHMPKNKKWVDAMVLRYTTKPGQTNKNGLVGKPIATMDEDIATAENDAPPTLEDIKDFLNVIGPSLSEINEQVTPPDDTGDDYEDVMDASGNPVMDEATGKAKRQKKAPPFVKKDPTVTTDKTVTKETMDSAITAAVTAAVAPLNAEIATLKQTSGSKVAITEIAARDNLAAKLSGFVGTFDHSAMTLRDVAKYGIEKLGIPTTDGQEFNSVTAWLHGRTPPRPAFSVDTLDNKDPNKPTSVDKFLAPVAA
jgi:hypothetical protein